MRITTKGQVTIPQHIRAKLGLTPHAEVEFVEEKGRVFLKKAKGAPRTTRFRNLRGIATVRMTTDEILELTRGER